MTWASGTLTAFDTETTGTDPTGCRLVSATVAVDTPGMPPAVVSYLVAVDEEIPAAASEVHGITTERARVEGLPLGDVLQDVTGQLAVSWRAGIPVVGMNLAYDFTVVDQELRRAGLSRLTIGGPVIDVFVLDKAVDKYRRGKRTLTALCEHYGVPFEGAHDATADALAAAGVARVMCKLADTAVLDPDAVARFYADRRYPRELVRAWQRLSGMPHAELFRQQQRWAAEQAHSFATYLKAEAAKHRNAAGEYDEGDPDAVSLLAQAAELSRCAASVSRDWPVRVGSAPAVAGPFQPAVCELPACGCSGLAHP